MLAKSRRMLLRSTGYGLGIWFFLVACTGVSWAEDEIHYYDRAAKSIVAVQAVVEQENAGGLRFRSSTRSEPMEVHAQDLIDVVYSVPGSLRLILTRARNEEKKSLTLGATQPERLQAITQAIRTAGFAGGRTPPLAVQNRAAASASGLGESRRIQRRSEFSDGVLASKRLLASASRHSPVGMSPRQPRRFRCGCPSLSLGAEPGRALSRGETGADAGNDSLGYFGQEHQTGFGCHRQAKS
jgi:hypothetical protein